LAACAPGNFAPTPAMVVISLTRPVTLLRQYRNQRFAKRVAKKRIFFCIALQTAIHRVVEIKNISYLISYISYLHQQLCNGETYEIFPLPKGVSVICKAGH
jgi:hypothetical protein